LLIAALIVPACGSDDSAARDSTPALGTGTYRGILSGGQESGTLDVTVAVGAAGTTNLHPLAVSGSNVSGLLIIANGPTISLSGTFDLATGTLSMSGGGFSFMGASASGSISGSYTSSSDGGAFVLLPTSAGAVSLFCGTFRGDDTGNWNVAAVAEGAAAGSFASMKGSGSFAGTWHGSTLTLNGSGVSASGTLTGGRGTGTWANGAAKGTWTTGACPAGASDAGANSGADAQADVGTSSPDANRVTPEAGSDGSGGSGGSAVIPVDGSSGSGGATNDAGIDARVDAVADAAITVDSSTEAGIADASSDAGADATAPAPAFVSASRTDVRVGSGDVVIVMQTTNVPTTFGVAISDTLCVTTWQAQDTVAFVVPAVMLGGAGTQAINVRNPVTGLLTHMFDLQIVATGNALPSITSLSVNSLPNTTTAAQTITITGTAFVQGASVQVNSELQAPANVAFVDATTITLTVLANSPYWLAAGTVNVQVVNPAAGGGASAPSPITVTGTNPAGNVTSIDTATTIGVGTVVDWFLQFHYSNWVPGAYATATKGATFNLGLCPSNVKNYCNATLPRALFTAAGDIVIALVNPAPGGGSGTTMTITVPVGHPSPSFTGGTFPNGVAVGSPMQSWTITGTGFDAATTVKFGTTDCTVTSYTATSLTVTVPATAFVAQGVFAMQIVAPGPGGGTVNTTFIQVITAPTLTSIVPTPNPVVHGQTASLAVTGAGFFQGVTLNVGGVDVQVPSYTNTTFTVALPAGQFSAAGSYPVYVYVTVQPQASFARSTTLMLTVQ
jgi:hypothetical protein